MSEEKSKEPPKVDDGDPRLDSFLQKAAPVIAEQRGFNAQARIRLEAIARDMRLPDDLFDQAIHMLQGSPPVSSKDRWVDAFTRYLHAKLEQSKHKILTAPQHERVMAVATTKFQLSETQARDVIREVTAERGIRRISQTEAENHIAEVVKSKVGDSWWLDDDTVTRLHSAGREWGLSDEQVDIIIRARTTANRRREKRQKRTVVWALVGAGAVLLVVLGFVVYINLFKGDDPVGGDESAQATETGDDKKKTAKNVKPPKWWDSDFVLEMVKARVRVPSFGDLYEGLASPKKEDRVTAYQQLVDLFDKTQENGKHADRVREVIVNLHAIDPEDECAQAMSAHVLNMVVVGEPLPRSPAVYDRAFRAVRLAIEMLGSDKLSDERAAELQRELGTIVGRPVSRGSSRLERQCLESLANRFFRQLIDKAADDPRRALVLHEKVFELAARYAHGAGVGALDEMDADFLFAALPAAGRSWHEFDSLIGKHIGSNKIDVLLKMLDLYETTDNLNLQNSLRGRLTAQVGAAPKSTSVKDTAFAVREKLGIAPTSAAKTARERWEVLQSQAEAAKPRLTQQRSDPRLLLEDSIKAAHLATLACAVAQQEPGFPLFDQLQEKGPPSLDDKGDDEDDAFSSPDRRVSFGRPSAAKLQKLDEYVGRLRVYQSQQLATRTSTVRGLKQLTDHILEIGPDQAAIIATYLLAIEDDYERKKVLEAIRPLGSWKQLQLALADQLVTSDASRFHLEQLLSELLGRRIEVEQRGGWRGRLREQLMRNALEELAIDAPAPADRSGDRMYDAASSRLRTLYNTRARLLGAPPAQYNGTRSPADALRLLISLSVERVSPYTLRAGHQQWLDDLPHRFEVVAYLGTNDLRRTVMLQRVWLRLLSMEIAGGRSDLTSRADDIVNGLESRDAETSDVLAQLRAGENATLQMWMLYAP